MSVVVPSRNRRATIWLSLVILFCAGLFVGRYIIPVEGQAPLIGVKDGQRTMNFPTFWEAWDELHTNFTGELNEKDLFYGAVEGMIRAAGDPYTVFADPEDTEQFESALSGSFSGVGIEIGLQNGLITVIAPLEGSPAAEAGVQAGDIIVTVDKTTITPDMSLDEVVRKIRGPKGSTVVLTVLHKDSRQTNEISIVRDTIEVESVKLTIEDGIAHLAITNFKDDTARQVSAAAREIKRAGVKGIILDVRSNPGGFLQAAVEISSEFLPADVVVVSERGKTSEEYRSRGAHTLVGIPVVVLVDAGSASASEIVAGALQDQVNAPIVGVKTFGKGSVQEFIKLDDGSSLRVTIAKWFTPKGRSIHEEGIAPTIEVKQDHETSEDEQLDRGREELKQRLN